ncbi:MAG: putative quinol monooxygenase [Legionella sp.]|uniref:putative quinol monooxygenase n=1 Tax=Legionella sp. TaxID=459 RepID=UPI0039E4740E
MSYFVCIAQIKINSGKEKRLLKELSALIKPTTAEPGCVSYELFQNVNQPQSFTMIEFFHSKEDFDFHQSQDYLLHYRETSKNLIESSQLIFCLTID